LAQGQAGLSVEPADICYGRCNVFDSGRGGGLDECNIVTEADGIYIRFGIEFLVNCADLIGMSVQIAY
jgi:hypothetical protein